MTDHDMDIETEQNCPKRLWVLLTLSDDELVGGGGELPQGLSFHLSRCDSCRAVADRLSDTTDRLRALGDFEPSGELFAAATARAVDALHDGARLTGRVDIDDEPLVLPVEESTSRRTRWAPRLAAAAVIVFAVTVWGAISFRDGFRAHRGAGSYASQGVVPASEDGRPARTRSTPPDPARQPADEARVRLVDVEQEPVIESEAGPAEDSPMPPKGRIVRHRSHFEAATADELDGPESIIVLPDFNQRNLGWGHLFDRQPPVRSTKPSQEDR